MRIMIIEDDPKIRQELSEFLNRYGYDPVFPDSFKHITTSILANPPDLILLDINLPVYDGYYICREIRKQADDYITKPYNTQILLARIASVLKRANPSSGSTTMSHNGLTLDLSRSVIQSARGETELTKNEVGILRLLLSHKNEIVSREAIMNALWQSDAFVDDNTLTVNINRLRRKISEIGLKDYLVTKRGQGYMV